MSRYIDADALKKQVESPYTEYPIMIQIRKTLKDFIDDAPSIDIVRCKECKYWDDTIPNEIYCSLLEGLCDISGDSFCSYGEREGE